ncbi:hypothetical protein TNCV_2833901 [Trichonephila clavipes]|nr:hypothetical protein TNCV_2833901 [Trichonephila clavipes]
MCEENEERSVDEIKETAKEGINPVILSKEPVHLDDDEIEKVKHRKRETALNAPFFATPIEAGAELDVCALQVNPLRRSPGDKVTNPCGLDLDNT